MKLDTLDAGADDQQEEGEERPDDGDPRGRDFLEGENEEMRLEAEVAAIAEKSDSGENESEGAPGDGDPGPVAFVIGENDDENGRGGGVKLGGFDGGAGGFAAEPARAEIEKHDDERKCDQAKRE